MKQNKYGTDLLIDVYENFQTFFPEGREDGVTNILTHGISIPEKASAKQLFSIVSREKFHKQFSQLSSDIFGGMDWSNLVAAGSLLCAFLTISRWLRFRISKSYPPAIFNIRYRYIRLWTRYNPGYRKSEIK